MRKAANNVLLLYVWLFVQICNTTFLCSFCCLINFTWNVVSRSRWNSLEARISALIQKVDCFPCFLHSKFWLRNYLVTNRYESDVCHFLPNEVHFHPMLKQALSFQYFHNNEYTRCYHIIRIRITPNDAEWIFLGLLTDSLLIRNRCLFVSLFYRHKSYPFCEHTQQMNGLLITVLTLPMFSGY